MPLNDDFKPGDIVICAGNGWGKEYHNSLCYIDKRGRITEGSDAMYGVTEIIARNSFGMAGARRSNMEKIGHIEELVR